MKLKFYKDSTGIYVDLPEYPGDKSDLEMVCGADDYLEYLARLWNIDLYKGITLDVEKSGVITNWDGLLVRDDLIAIPSGANYIGLIQTEEPRSMWLCDVMKFVFGEFPGVLNFKVLEDEN